jgi:hypothetical protein
MLRVQNFASVGIIYLLSDPRQILVEAKTPDYPVKCFAGRLLIIGGNWAGPNAIADLTPRATLIREFSEEFGFDKPMANTGELAEILGGGKIEDYHVESNPGFTPNESAASQLFLLRKFIMDGYRPFGTFVPFIPEKIFRQADPDYNKGDFRYLVSVFSVGLDDVTWQSLLLLQQEAGNLSNESLTVITSAQQIISTGWETAWGQDQVLQQFFQHHGIAEASNFPLIGGVETIRTDLNPDATYEEYLKDFTPTKRP